MSQTLFRHSMLCNAVVWAWLHDVDEAEAARDGVAGCRHCPGKLHSARYPRKPYGLTFVETPRFTGALYKASGWNCAGTTQGRGRYDRHTKRDQPKKDSGSDPSERAGSELSTDDIMGVHHGVT